MNELLLKYSDHKFFNEIISETKNVTLLQIQTKIISTIITLDSKNIILDNVKRLAIDGAFDEIPSIRSLCWKVLLGYLGLNIYNWENEINNKRLIYDNLKKKYIIQVGNLLKNKKKKKFDHPLSITADSKWNEHFQDNDLNDMIEKDLLRTRSEMDFFKKQNDKKESHINVLKRILFIFSKENEDVKYVQGLNEILAVIYYCFSNDRNPFFKYDIEADTYFCFCNLMKDIKNIYIAKMDDTEIGIEFMLIYLQELLQMYDKEIYTKLNDENIDYHYFAFQWISLMFTQQYDIYDVSRLWDNILANSDKFKFIYEICLAVLKIKKSDILFNNFSGIMNTLQDFSNTDIQKVLKVLESNSSKYNRIYKEFLEKRKK